MQEEIELSNKLKKYMNENNLSNLDLIHELLIPANVLNRILRGQKIKTSTLNYIKERLDKIMKEGEGNE